MHPRLTKIDYKIIEKGWGFEKILFSDNELCGKILHFNKGSQFSSHMHIEKLEYFFVTYGLLEVEGINTENASKYIIKLSPGDTLQVPRFTFHKIKALEESEIIEFSTKDILTDSYRVEKGDSQK